MKLLRPEFLTIALMTLPILVVVAAFGLRRVPWPSRMASVVLRLAMIVLVALVIGRPFEEITQTGQAGIALVSERGPAETVAFAQVGAASLGEDWWTLKDSDGKPMAVNATGTKQWAFDDFLQRVVGRADLRSLRAVVPESIAGRLLAYAETSTTPSRVEVFSDDTDPTEEESEATSPPQGDLPWLQLSLPPFVVAGEPVMLGVRSRPLDSPLNLRLLLDGQEIAAAPSSPTLQHLLNFPQAGEVHHVRVEGLLANGDLLTAEQSVAVVDEQEVVLVLSSRVAEVDTWSALLPKFKVFGVSADALDAPVLRTGVRMVVVPLLDQARLEASQVSLLRDFASAGGLVLTTGLREKQALALQEGQEGPSPRATNAANAELLGFHIAHVPPPEPDPVAEPEAPEEPEKPEEGPGVTKEDVEADVARVSLVFVVDHSFSMMINNRWEHTKSALNSALESVHDWDRAGILLFTGDSRWIGGIGPQGMSDERRKFIRRYLDNNPPTVVQGGSTDIYAAVKTAIEALDTDTASVRFIVVLSDGDEGKERKPGEDHIALRKLAISKGIGIAAIRVGVLEDIAVIEALKASVMKGLVTREEFYNTVFATDEKVEIPRLSLNYVTLAYRAYEEKKKKAEEDQEKENPAEPVEEPEPDPQPEPEPKPDAKPVIAPDRFLPGSVEALVQLAGQAVFGVAELPPVGDKLAAIEYVSKDLTALASHSPHKVSLPLIVHRSEGMGGVLSFHFPLDAISAGDWLAQRDDLAKLVDSAIQQLSHRQSGPARVLWSPEAVPGRFSIRSSLPPEELSFLGIGEQVEYDLAVTWNGDKAVSVCPPSCRFVEVRNREGAVLFRTSVPSIKRQQAPRSVRHGLMSYSNGTFPVSPPPQTVQRKDTSESMLWLLAVALLLMPIERYLRRT